MKAATTAEEMIQSWSTVGERHQPQILLYSLSVVKMSTHLDAYSYVQRLKSATKKKLNDISLSRLSSCLLTQEYLYRFVAVATGGWAAGPWQRSRSRGKGRVCTVHACDANPHILRWCVCESGMCLYSLQLRKSLKSVGTLVICNISCLFGHLDV